METIIKGEIPFVRILIPLASGISAAYLFLPSSALMAVCTCAALMCLLTLSCIVIFYRRHYSYRNRWMAGMLVNAIVFLAGYALTAYKSQRLDKSHFSKSAYEFLVVRICSEPKLSGDILRFESDVSQGWRHDRFYPLTGKLLITLKTTSVKDYRYGDVLLIPAAYTEVEGPLNPAEFNYKAYLADHYIYHQAYLTGGQVHRLDRDRGNPFVAAALRIREQLVLKFNRYISKQDAASVAATLILGYRADLSREVLDAYSRTGTMHVLSVSGMHVGIVFMVILFMLSFMDRSKRLRLIRAVLIIILIWLYALITGFSSAACRAALMLTFVVIGKAIQKSQNTYNLIAISAVLLLIYNPLFLVEVGFQLSYLAVLGLVYLYPGIYRLFYIKNALADKLWGYMSLSFAAQLATSPLSMYYFHQFPVYFLISNLFIILPVTVSMYAGLSFILVPWDVLLKPLGWLLEKSISFTNAGLFYVENLPFAAIDGIWMSRLTLLLVCGLLFSVVCMLFYRIRYFLYSTSSALLLLLLVNSCSGIKSEKQNQVVFYSLRKNTAIGFFEGREAFLISDLKPEDRTFTYSVKPSLDSNAVRVRWFLAPGEAWSDRNFYSDGNFIRFRNRKLLIWDKSFDKKRFSGLISVDAVLFRGNPAITIALLAKNVRFKMLLIDPSNADYRIKKWQQEAAAMATRTYVLKRNPAFIIKI